MVAHDVLTRETSADARAFYLQAAFRALLDAMARPGEIAGLPRAEREGAADASAAGLVEPSLVVADVLVDAATSFAVAGDAAAVAERVLARRTHAAVADIPSASYVFLPAGVRDEKAARAVAALCPGTLVEPHLGATLVVECETLLGTDAAGNSAGSACGSRATSTWTLSGPGIKASSTVTCDRADVLVARAERADEFPCGIDLILVDAVGHVAALPRTTRAELCLQTDAKEVSSWAM